MHVHVDIADLTARNIRNLFNIVATKEDLIYKAFDVSDTRKDRWCKSNDFWFMMRINECKNPTMNTLRRAWYNHSSEGVFTHYHSSRYHMLNLHSYFIGKGVEFRLFNSTLNEVEVKANIIFAVATCCLAEYQNKSCYKSYPWNKSSEKSQMSNLVYRLCLSGSEFSEIRKVYLKNLNNKNRRIAA